MSKPEVVSLFSGAGGLDVGLERAGWRTVVATDHSSDSMETLRQSQSARIPVPGKRSTYLQGASLLNRDVRELDADDLTPKSAPFGWTPDLLAGGPPCQPWSSAGSQRGLRDPRGQLIGHMLRLVGELQPKYVLFENVRGLVTARGKTGRPGEVLESIQKDLHETHGYVSRIATLNAADFGAAQRRVRLILIATKEYGLPLFPPPTHDRAAADGRLPWITLRHALSRISPTNRDEFVYPSGDRAHALRSLEPGKGLKTGGRVMTNRPGGHWGYRQDSFLADLEAPSRTVRAASTPDWIRLDGEDMRRLTWRECAMLQGFPPEWSFAGGIGSKFTQIGNAVQTNVAESVGKTIASCLAEGPVAGGQTMPSWPDYLRERVRYTQSEQRVNGHLRSRSFDDTAA